MGTVPLGTVPTPLMRTRLLIFLSLLIGAAAGALYGGVFRDSTPAASGALGPPS